MKPLYTIGIRALEECVSLLRDSDMRSVVDIRSARRLESVPGLTATPCQKLKAGTAPRARCAGWESCY